MSFFPFFIELKDQNCVLVGGGRIAFHKAKVLLSFGARIKAVSLTFCPEFVELQKEYLDKISLVTKQYEESDLEDAMVCVAATDENEVNSLVAEICKKRHILYNVVDQKELCGFYFPSYVKRGEFVVAVSSGGNSPLLTQKVKKGVEDMLPDYIAKLNEQLGELREFAKEHFDTEADRKAFYQSVVSEAEEKERALTANELLSMKSGSKILEQTDEQTDE